MTRARHGRHLPLALTMGDPAGIGIETALAAWLGRERFALPPFLLYADPDAVRSRALLLALKVPLIEVADARNAFSLFAKALPVKPIKLAQPAQLGQPEPRNAPAILQSIEEAALGVLDGATLGLVTNPIAKSVLHEAGFPYPGHTEFLGEIAKRALPGRMLTDPVMMLTGAGLRVVPVTIHIPLSQVAFALTRERICATAATVCDALIRDFGIAAPRLAIAGLNPHAGESGTLGEEEQDIIAPAIEDLKAKGLQVSGPFAADTLFHDAARQTYDAAICMYHDQALIPLKTLAFETGANVTLGLPFVRTSPDHGTAFDIAGTGRASPMSLVESIKLAAEVAGNRAAADTANHLR